MLVIRILIEAAKLLKNYRNIYKSLRLKYFAATMGLLMHIESRFVPFFVCRNEESGYICTDFLKLIVLNMKKFTLLLLAMVSAMAVGAQQKAAGDVFTYDGTLNVSMGGEPVVNGDAVSITLEEVENGTYKFTLPNLTVLGMQLGDIVLDDVTRVDANADGIYEINGTVDDMSLMEGAIHAKVDVAGTESSTGDINLGLNILWYQDYPQNTVTMPITGSFVGTLKQGGVEGVDASGASLYGVAGAAVVNGFAGNVEVYATDGRLVKVARVDGNAEIALGSGLYIVRAGAKTQKVVVK